MIRIIPPHSGSILFQRLIKREVIILEMGCRQGAAPHFYVISQVPAILHHLQPLYHFLLGPPGNRDLRGMDGQVFVVFADRINLLEIDDKGPVNPDKLISRQLSFNISKRDRQEVVLILRKHFAVISVCFHV